MAKILVVDDDGPLVDILTDILSMEHNSVETANNGVDGLNMLSANAYDVAVLDWNLPDMTGVDICRRYKDSGGLAKIIMLTAKSMIRDRVTGLDAGADDYLIKPFSPEELSARVRALTRRKAQHAKNRAAEALSFGGLSLHPKAKELTRDGSPVKLNAKEFALLEFLMSNPNQVFSPNELIDSVWSEDCEVSTDTIRVYITRIREKIDRGNENSFIKTVHAVGYKFVPPGSSAVE